MTSWASSRPRRTRALCAHRALSSRDRTRDTHPRYLGKLIIAVYSKPRERAPPHFHVIAPDVDVTVRLDILQVLAGRSDRKAFAAALTWAEANMDLLWAKSRDLNG